MSVSAEEPVPLQENQQKSVMLVTWSQANDLLLPDPDSPRQSFGSLVSSKFPHVMYWCCGQEQHRLGGHHYHLAIKLSKKVRWLSVSRELNRLGIQCHFHAFKDGAYQTAFQYTTKEDTNFVKSPGHPVLIVLPPKTMRPLKRSSTPAADNQFGPSASSTLSSTFVDEQPQEVHDQQDNEREMPPAKLKKLNNIQVAQVMIEHSIKDDLELCSLANTLCSNGQSELADWVLLHPNVKYRKEVIESAWKMHTASDVLACRSTPRLEKLQALLHTEHAEDEERNLRCGGKWLSAALDILGRNAIDVKSYQDAVRECLKRGRDKKNNVFLVGQSNCGKTFLFRPLEKIFDTFCNPAQGSFNWVSAPSKEVIYLNDFRYPPIDKGADKILPWQDFLNLCDADKLSIQAPKSYYASNIEWTAKQPILGSGPSEIKYITSGREDRGETQMMNNRWNYFYLNNPIPADKIDSGILPCTRCFAHLILNGEDMRH